MNAKDILTVKIDGYGMNGEGVAHTADATIFVPFTMLGEEVKVVVDRVQGKVAFAHIIKMLAPSADRREKSCSVFGKCGGCTMQHIPYEKQLEIKKQNVQNLFKKNCSIDIDIGKVFSANEFGYRNKVALPFGVNEQGKAVLGFYKAGTHKVQAVDNCPLHQDWIKKLIFTVSKFANDNHISVYDERTKKGVLKHLVARRLPYENDYNYAIILVINAKKLEKSGAFVSALQSAFGSRAYIYLCENTACNNVILTDKITALMGENQIKTDFCDKVVEVSPLSFLQVNYAVASKIYADVVAEICEGDKVLDAYSGTGIMSALIGEKASKVIGVEIIESAVKNAIKNAEYCGVSDKVTHICADVKDALPKVKKMLGEDFICVTDPPRAGLDKEVVDTLVQYSPKKIIYVSCNPATLTRDVKILRDGGYEISFVRCYDMFPQTAHIETLVSLIKKS